MPKYDYVCGNQTCTCLDEVQELVHPISDCDETQFCYACDAPMKRVIRSVPTAVFLGPGFACNDNVARPNVGRNPNNQNRYSSD